MMDANGSGGTMRFDEYGFAVLGDEKEERCHVYRCGRTLFSEVVQGIVLWGLQLAGNDSSKPLIIICIWRNILTN